MRISDESNKIIVSFGLRPYIADDTYCTDGEVSHYMEIEAHILTARAHSQR